MNGSTLKWHINPMVAGMARVQNGDGTSFFQQADGLGSSWLGVHGYDGSIAYDRAYAPFGETYNESSSTNRNFTGQTQDTASGIYDFLFRQYSPSQGRWQVPDPAGMAAVDITNPQSWNRYAYVANNPLSNIDPKGLYIQDCVWDGCSFQGVMGGGGGFIGGGGYGGNDGFAQGITSVAPTSTLANYETYEEARHESIITTGWDPELGINRTTTEYFFTGGDTSSILEQQKELAAIQLGQLQCQGCDADTVASQIQSDYNNMIVAPIGPNKDGLIGGNYNFQLPGLDTNSFGCLMGRCGGIDSLHFHGDGTFHVDTANSFNFLGVGAAIHSIFDVLGGHTWWQNGIPRPWWQ
jgi:RHS repeat-associated protein